jgi:hypothetical protein
VASTVFEMGAIVAAVGYILFMRRRERERER